MSEITGDSGNNIPKGGTGDNTIHAGGGNDQVCGGAGDDTVYANAVAGAKDTYEGGSGIDTLRIIIRQAARKANTLSQQEVLDYLAFLAANTLPNGHINNSNFTLTSTPNAFFFDVTRVNDAPEGTDKTVITNQNKARAFTAADFGFTDTDSNPANAFSAAEITTTPVAGSLTLNGSAASINERKSTPSRSTNDLLGN